MINFIMSIIIVLLSEKSLFPTDTTCKMMEPRILDESPYGFYEWKIKSLQFWGENPFGNWTICIKDEVNNRSVLSMFKNY